MILKRNFLYPVMCHEAPESISQKILSDNLEGVKLEFCKKSHLSVSVLGDCPNRPLVVLPSPAAPTKTFAVRDFLLPFPTAVPLRDGVAGIGLLFPRLPVSIRPTHPVLPPFLPKLPPPLDYPLPEKGAAEKVAAVCGCCCCVNMEAANAVVPPLLFVLASAGATGLIPSCPFPSPGKVMLLMESVDKNK